MSISASDEFLTALPLPTGTTATLDLARIFHPVAEAVRLSRPEIGETLTRSATTEHWTDHTKHEISGPGAPGAALLRVVDVTVRFGGITALDGVSFDLAPGRICGLIGPNGAGKTTLLNCLSRIYAWERGDIAFAGRSLLTLRRHQIAPLGIGRTFQNLALFRSMSVFENIMVGRHCRTHSGFFANAVRLPRVDRERRAAAGRADELLHFLDLEAVRDTRVSELPFGTQKRVELARALASDPRLLLLDEPASGLNHEEVGTLGRLIRDIRQKLGLTVLLIEHHMPLIMEVSDQIVVLNFGRKIAEGTPAEIRRHPEVIQAYLGDVQP